MNISGAAFKLTNKDILSIINDFIKIKGLKIDNLYINKYFYISGSYRKVINIPFKISVFLVEVGKSKLVFQLKEIKILKCHIFKWIKNLILKMLLKDIKNNGIIYSKGNIYIDLAVILKGLPLGLDFKFTEIELRENLLLIEAKDIKINFGEVKASTVKNEITESVLENKLSLEESKADNKKAISESDRYEIKRKEIKSKIPEKYKEFFPYIMLLPDIFILFLRLYKDERVPVKIKIKCAVITAYLSSPIDIVPDFIPIIGQMDDLAMAFLVLNTILCEVPENVIRENWSGNEDIILTIRKVLAFLHKFVGESNASKAIRKVKDFLQDKKKEKGFQGEK